MITTTEKLEAMVDADQAWNVLLALELVLEEKAQHLEANWQDAKSAKVYRRFSAKVGKLARELEQFDI